MTATFKQDIRLSRDTLILEESRLVVSTDVGGLHGEKIIPLADFCPEVRRYKKHFALLSVIPVSLAAALWWAASALLHQQAVDHVIVVAPIIGIAIALWYVVDGQRG